MALNTLINASTLRLARCSIVVLLIGRLLDPDKEICILPLASRHTTIGRDKGVKASAYIKSIAITIEFEGHK
jgi:hypothetical protein